MDQDRRPVEVDDVGNSRRNDPDHVAVHFPAFDLAINALPLRANMRGAEGGCDLGAVMEMTLPDGAMLFCAVKAVIGVVLRHVFAWGTRLQANQELLVRYCLDSDLWG